MAQLSDVQTLLSQASTSIASDDFYSAYKYALQAKILMAGIPDSSLGATGLKLRDDLKQIIEITQREAAGSNSTTTAARTIQQREVEYL